jgi:hypothetical protein
MMKALGVLMLTIFGTAIASASPISVTCSLTSGSNTVTSTTTSGNPTTTGTFTCTFPTLPVGDMLTSVDLIINDDYSLGTANSNNEVAFSYSTLNFIGATSLTTTVLGLGGASPFGVSSTFGGIVGQAGTPTCAQDSENAFDCESSSPFASTTTFTVTGSSSWVQGSLQLGGTDEFSVGYAYTYSTPTQTPEPATLTLIGCAGLIGIGLAARFRKKV